MRRLRATLRFGLICLFAMLCLSLASAPGAWAQSINCSAKVELEQGSPKQLKSIAHGMLKKQYPYLVGQEGSEVSMISLGEIKQVQRLPEEDKGEMIGLLIFQVETTGGEKKKLGLNGSTFFVGKGPGGAERIPFASIKKITIICP